jgi:hypothetical protein
MKTRFEWNLFDDYSIFHTPEAKIHHHLLMGHKMFDSYHYSIPTHLYDPQNHTENGIYDRFDVAGRPEILNNKDELDEYKKQIREEFNQKRNLPVAERLQFQREAVEIAIAKKLFTCPEEIHEYFVWLKNQNRPIRQQYTADFSKMWEA